MDVTIRQHLKRRVWWCAAVAVCGWLMFPLGAAIAQRLPPGVPRGAVPAVGALMFIGAILVVQWAVRCPKCRARLGRTIAMPLTFSWGSGPKINFCPYCGVSLDEPLPRREQAAQSQDPIHPA